MLCPALTMLNRCGVYDDRPTICRLWGATAVLSCPYGCVPAGGHMSEREAHLLLADVAELSGDVRQARRLRALWQDPEQAARSEAQLRVYMQSHQAEMELRRRLAEVSGTAVYVRGRSGGLATWRESS